MEFAYDHIQEETVASGPSDGKGKDPERPKESLNEEFQEAYRAISASPWGAKFGSFIGTVKKQGESYYEVGKKEAATRAEQASKGFSVVRSEIVSRTRSLSINQSGAPSTGAQKTQQTGETSKDGAVAGANEKAVAEEGLLSKLKKGAAQRISEIEAAEARADEYLLRFGTNIGNFLKEAVTIRPPEGSDEATGEKEVVFEQKGEEGKRQIYSTRLDAQLHLLHGNLELFKTDSTEPTFVEWSKDFSADKKTEQIAADLDKYPELRSTMEKLVPDSVQYGDFWRRYYFLRNELDMEEQKRKELLKGATTLDEEEVAWDEDDEDEEEESSDDEKPKSSKEVPKPTATSPPVQAATSAATLAPTAKTDTAPAASTETLIPKEELLKPKNSIDVTSQPDSESSYDVVSGVPSKAPSQATGSPKAAKVSKPDGEEEGEEEDDSEDDASSEEDWE
ncbi:uncharacterized protein H6S33_000520 [Morchella sextelata]|uniref:uncharacterized protein n=1 Tax=Morchella sextelata TaxID=1174677 RepID=UPI001D044482|nr:uncharacterized protein H6S33_000520 [Morchella sextelata]KAH0614884.1 hypothetical protein H6S33_000520 [Morchella sextelata]